MAFLNPFLSAKYILTSNKSPLLTNVNNSFKKKIDIYEAKRKQYSKTKNKTNNISKLFDQTRLNSAILCNYLTNRQPLVSNHSLIKHCL